MEIKFEDYDRQLNEYVQEAIDGVVENIMDVHYSHVTDEDERDQININLTNILKKRLEKKWNEDRERAARMQDNFIALQRAKSYLKNYPEKETIYFSNSDQIKYVLNSGLFKNHEVRTYISRMRGHSYLLYWPKGMTEKEAFEN